MSEIACYRQKRWDSKIRPRVARLLLMRFPGLRCSLAFGVQISIFLLPAQAMNMPHYDVNSLVYMSTDVVVAKLSENTQQGFTATVIETLYGSLHPGDRVEQLSPFLTFFKPMEDGMRVVLFLDRRPRQYDFFHQDAAKSPFAVPPSGVYLIDEYDHVHEYFQINNPGPYAAQDYSFFLEKRVPTKEQDLALPTLATTKDQISAAIKSVEPVRPLLNKAAVREDVPVLMHLIDLTSSSKVDCELTPGERDSRTRFATIAFFEGSRTAPQSLCKCRRLWRYWKCHRIYTTQLFDYGQRIRRRASQVPRSDLLEPKRNSCTPCLCSTSSARPWRVPQRTSYGPLKGAADRRKKLARAVCERDSVEIENHL